MADEDYDVIVVGSGFGGSTAALRLTEKGYRVAVLESGRRFDETTFPRTSWRLRSFFWAPRIGLLGIQKLSLLRNVMVLSGVGVGGRLPGLWQHALRALPFLLLRRPLEPHHRLARRADTVLRPGKAHARCRCESDHDCGRRRDAGRRRRNGGRGDLWSHAGRVCTSVNPALKSADPYFGGAGPARKGCTECGECMTGLSPRRQEHAPEELPLPRRAGGARGVARSRP